MVTPPNSTSAFADDIASRHRRRLKLIEQEDQSTPPNALFSVAVPIQLIYGDVSKDSLNSDRNIVEYAIRFANQEEDRAKANQFLQSLNELQKSGLLKRSTDPALRNLRSILTELSEPRIRYRREELRRLFSALISDRNSRTDTKGSNSLDTVFCEVHERSQHISWKSTLVRVEGGATWRHKAVINEPDAFCGFIVSLLLSHDSLIPSRDIGPDLCQCRYCSRFFLAVKRGQHQGRPERLYCEAQHRKDAHALGGAARQRVRRAKKRATEILRAQGYARSEIERVIDRVSKEHPDATGKEVAASASAAIQVERNTRRHSQTHVTPRRRTSAANHK